MAPPLSNGVPEELTAELAKVIWDPEKAKLLVKAAGFPPADIPDFKTARGFWSLTLEEANNGKILGGVGALAAKAAAQYPGNEIFAGYKNPPTPKPVDERRVIQPISAGAGLTGTVRRVRERMARDKPGEALTKIRASTPAATIEILDFLVREYFDDGKPVPGSYVRTRCFDEEPDEGNLILMELTRYDLVKREGGVGPGENYTPTLLGQLTGKTGHVTGGVLLALRDLFRWRLKSEKHPGKFCWDDIQKYGYDDNDYFLVFCAIWSSHLYSSATWRHDTREFAFSLPRRVEVIARCHDFEALVRCLHIEVPS